MAGFFGTLKNVMFKAAPYAAVGGVGALATQIPNLFGGDEEIGTKKKDTGLGMDTYYAGENYGYQSPGSFLKIDPTKATSDARERARILAVQDTLRDAIARAHSPGGSSAPGGSQAPGGSNTPGGGKVVPPQGTPDQDKTDKTLPGPTTKPPAQTPDALIDDFKTVLKDYLSPESVAKRSDIDTENAIRRMLVTNALSMRQSRENTARQAELRKMQEWGLRERAIIEADTRQTIATANAIALSLTPNQGLAQELTRAYSAALTPFTNITVS